MEDRDGGGPETGRLFINSLNAYGRMAIPAHGPPPPEARFFGWNGFGTIPAIPPGFELSSQAHDPTSPIESSDEFDMDVEIVECAPADGTFDNPIVLEDETDDEILYVEEIHRHEEPALQPVLPDPEDLRLIWTQMFGPFSLKREKNEEAEVPALDATSSGGSSLGRSLLLTPNGEVDDVFRLSKKILMVPEDAWRNMDEMEDEKEEVIQDTHPEPIEEVQPPTNDIVQNLGHIHGSTMNKDEMVFAEGLSPWMQELISASDAPQQKQDRAIKYCLKCQFGHEELRPAGWCCTKKDGVYQCPHRKCRCPKCVKVDGQRQLMRLNYYKRRDAKRQQ